MKNIYSATYSAFNAKRGMHNTICGFPCKLKILQCVCSYLPQDLRLFFSFYLGRSTNRMDSKENLLGVAHMKGQCRSLITSRCAHSGLIISEMRCVSQGLLTLILSGQRSSILEALEVQAALGHGRWSREGKELSQTGVDLIPPRCCGWWDAGGCRPRHAHLCLSLLSEPCPGHADWVPQSGLGHLHSSVAPRPRMCSHTQLAL